MERGYCGFDGYMVIGSGRSQLVKSLKGQILCSMDFLSDKNHKRVLGDMTVLLFLYGFIIRRKNIWEEQQFYFLRA